MAKTQLKSNICLTDIEVFMFRCQSLLSKELKINTYHFQLSQPTIRREGDARLKGASSNKGKHVGVATNVYLRKVLEKQKKVCKF